MITVIIIIIMIMVISRKKNKHKKKCSKAAHVTKTSQRSTNEGTPPPIAQFSLGIFSIYLLIAFFKDHQTLNIVFAGDFDDPVHSDENDRVNTILAYQYHEIDISYL